MVPDQYMLIGKDICDRCGLPKTWHPTHKCIRKAPYKTRDRQPVFLGMRVWYCHPYEGKILTGMVRFVQKFATIVAYRYPQDRHKNEFRLAHDHPWPLCWCFATEQAALAFKDKNVRISR